MLHTVLIAAVIFASVPMWSVHAALLVGEKERARVEAKLSGETPQWLMAYYVGYQNGYLKPRDVDYSLMTHIVVGGVGVNADGTLDEHWHMANGDGREMALDVGKRAKRAGVKTLVWLGGPNEEDKFYAATAPEYRATFVKNIIALVAEYGYDGVDIDWEPIRAKDTERVLALVKELRAAAPDMLITLPANWVPTTILTTKDLSAYKDIAKYVDRMFIMSYSMAGAWPGWKSWHGGALVGDTVSTPGSIRTSVTAYTRAGVPNEKLGIGIGTYATCWKYPVREPRQTLPKNFTSANVSVMSMRTFMDDYYSSRREKWDDRAKVPYLSYSRGKGDNKCAFISFENERSIAEKMKYMKSEKLGGAIVWNIGTGYFPDASRSKRNPYLKAAWEAMQ